MIKLSIKITFLWVLLLPYSTLSADQHAFSLPEPLQGFALSDKAMRELPGWRPPKRILITFDASRFGNLEQELHGVELVTLSGEQATKDIKGEFDGIITACWMSSGLDAIKATRWVHSLSAGVEGCLNHPRLQDSVDTVLTNSRGAAADTIAEHAIALMLSIVRGVPQYRDNMAQAHWNRDIEDGPDLETLQSKTLLVLGLGHIGREAAKRAHALGMRVIATRNSSRQGPDYVDYVGLSDESLDLAAKADVVLNALPLTPATEDLVNAEFLARMPNTGILINVGRGGTVDTEALIEALENGDIAAAGLDVTDPEPLPKDNKLWQMGNVLITPHTAARSAQSMQLTLLIAKENLKRFVAGERLINPVNRQRAY